MMREDAGGSVSHRTSASRAEMAPLVPREATRVLDVGCARGGFGTALRDHHFDGTLWGIDPLIGRAAFEQSGNASAYDRFIDGRFPDDLTDIEPFDCVVFNDVLEHLVDPWDALRWTRTNALDPGGCVVSSIPNVRYVKVVWDLAARGQWAYRDSGILDRTHLRFFTRSSMQELFERAGYTVERLEPASVPTVGKRGLAWRLLPARARDILVQQYAIRARVTT